MNARERALAVMHGEEPDRIPVFAYADLRTGPPGGWVRRLVKRGLGLFYAMSLHEPWLAFPLGGISYLKGIRYSKTRYGEMGLLKCRHTFETHLGSVTSVVAQNPIDFFLGSIEEHFVKQPSDWLIINFIFKTIRDHMSPDYESFERMEDTLGDSGITVAWLQKTPFQRAWVELASPERAVVDFTEQVDELMEFFEIQEQLHTRAAEFLAESPAKCAIVFDHITDTISPKYFEEYCIPFYKIYAKAVEGTDIILGCHMDGRVRHLKKEIASMPLKIIESITVPPMGNVSLSEAKESWPDKVLFVNCPPHLNWVEPEDVREGYAEVAEEWKSKSILIEHSEEIPLEKLEMNLSAALDVFGY